MRKFKIAILTESLNTSSGSRAPVELAKNLSQLGNSVTIYARDKSIVKNLSGVKVVALSKPKNFLESRAIPNFELTKLLKKNPPDIALLTSFLPSLLAAKIAKIPVIKIYMGTQFDAFLENKNPDQKISNLDKLLNLIINLLIYSLEFISIRYSDFVIAISPYSGSQVRNLFRRKVDQVIYLGGDHLNLKLRASHQNSKSFNLLSVSRITPYKNFHILVSCVKELKTNANVTLTIAGKNEKSKYLKYLKKISSPNTKFTLDPSDHQLTKLYSSCDVYITADRYLFFGLPIAEAAFFSNSHFC